ncbi:U3 snoRNP protein, partial [Nowakowskiella sp. JEL0078]
MDLTINADASLLDWAFHAIAYLFKYLSKELLSDMIPTYLLLSKLIKDHRLFIRVFAAEAYGFLLRKAKGDIMEMTYKSIIKSLEMDSSTSYSEGVALIFFEALKGVKEKLHSRASVILLTVLSFLDGTSEILMETCKNLFHLISNHSTNENLREIWTIIIDFNLKKLKEATENQSTSSWGSVRQLLSVTRVWVGSHKGGRITSCKQVYQFLTLVANSCSDAPLNVKEEVVRISLTLLILCKSVDEVITHGKKLIDSIFLWPEIVLSYRLRLRNYIQDNWDAHQNECILILSDILGSDFKYIKSTISASMLGIDGLLRFPTIRNTDITINLLEFIQTPREWSTYTSEFMSTQTLNDLKSDLPIVSAALTILTHVSVENFKSMEAYNSLLKQLILALNQNTEERLSKVGIISGEAKTAIANLAALCLEIIITRAVAICDYDILDTIWELVMNTFLESSLENPFALETIATFVETLNS